MFVGGIEIDFDEISFEWISFNRQRHSFFSVHPTEKSGGRSDSNKLFQAPKILHLICIENHYSCLSLKLQFKAITIEIRWKKSFFLLLYSKDLSEKLDYIEDFLCCKGKLKYINSRVLESFKFPGMFICCLRQKKVPICAYFMRLGRLFAWTLKDNPKRNTN